MAYEPSPTRYKDASFRRCGKSGIQLPPISVGLWHNFGHVDTRRVGREIIRYAFDQGITHFDLANNYGPPPGSAEENFGRILRKDFDGYLRDELIISTKAGYTMWDGPYGDWGSRKYLLSSLDQSLDRMDIEYVDIFYSHRPDPITPLEETMGALASAVQQGKALYVGVSNYPADLTLKACKILEELGTPCLIHQPRYNMFDRWVEDEGLLDVLGEQSVGCIPFSPLEQGVLTDRYLFGIPEDSRAAKEHGFLQRNQITDDVLRKVRELNEIAVTRGQSLAQMAIAWLLKDERVTSVLVGVSTLDQLKQNLDWKINPDFADDELSAIRDILIS